MAFRPGTKLPKSADEIDGTLKSAIGVLRQMGCRQHG